MQDPCGAARSLISDGPLLELVGIEPERIVIRARSCAGGARSRACGKDAARAHSVYTRTIADLPWRGAPVILRVCARRFFCDEPSCERKIFCERLPDVAAYARKTGRLGEALLAIVLELGGRAGSRLAAELGLVEQWRDIRRLHLAGANIRFIARKLGVGSRTVYRYRDLQEPPPRQTHTTRTSVLDPYVPYLLERWEEGCREGKRLLREIRERGYRNSEKTFIRFTAELRRGDRR